MGDIEDEKGGAQILSRGERMFCEAKPATPRAVNQANKGGASLYQRALAIYNEGSDEWCIPNRGTKAWAKLEAIRDSLTTRSKPKAKRATAKPSAKRATFKRNVVKSSAKASDAQPRATATRTSRGEAPRRKQASEAERVASALANLATKRNRVISIPRTIVGRTDIQDTDKQDAGLAKLEAKLDKAITTATDAAALATDTARATATATTTATDAKLKKLTRKLKDATAATTAAATAVASAPVVATASATTASDSERKLMKLANKLKLATDTAAAATITNNATADAKLSKLVADLRVAQAQAAASASATDAKLFRLTAELERATRAALSTLPQTPARQSALSKVGKLAANITYYAATTVASGVATVAHGLAGAVGRKAIEYAASKVAPVPPASATDIPPTTATPTITDIADVEPAREIPEGKQEVSPKPRRAKQAKPARESPSPKRSGEIEAKTPSPKVSPKPSPKPEKKPRAKPSPKPKLDIGESQITEGKQPAEPLQRLPPLVIKYWGFIEAARELGKFNTEDMASRVMGIKGKTKRNNEFIRIRDEWRAASGKYHKKRADVIPTDYKNLPKSGEATEQVMTKASANIILYGKDGKKIRGVVGAWMDANKPATATATTAETEPEFEESAIVGSETEAPQSQPLESIDISGISSTQSTPSRTSRTATQSRVDESRDIPDDPLARMEGIDIIGSSLGQGFREPLTPEEFVIQQMRRAVYGGDGLIHDIRRGGAYESRPPWISS